jgi:hypothetical protein
LKSKQRIKPKARQNDSLFAFQIRCTLGGLTKEASFNDYSFSEKSILVLNLAGFDAKIHLNHYTKSKIHFGLFFH